MLRRTLASGLALGCLLLACGGSSSQNTPLPVANGDDDAGGTPGTDAGTPGNPGGDDAGSPGADAGRDTGVSPRDSGPGNPGVDASFPNEPGDGTPTRQACTGNFGNGLSTSGVHGRLDGLLVSLVAPHSAGGQQCNGDSTHLHLQISMAGSIYDVAVNLDTLYLEQDGPMPTSDAWSEGWHTADALDYPKVGLHSASFTQPASQTALLTLLESALANANHLSVYATAYGPDGIHDVHRRGSGGIDGAIVIDPLSTTSHVFYFCFNTDTF